MPRFNKSTNPSGANNLTGWLGGGSQTRLTGLSGTPQSTGASVAMGTGSFGSSLGCAVGTASAGQTWTGVGWVRSSVARTIRAALVTWQGSTFVAGGVIGTTDTALAANVWTQIRVTGTLGSGTYDGVNFHLDIPTSGTAGTLSLSSCRIEQINDATLVYADGDSGDGWGWDGTAGNSASTQPDAVTVPDTGSGSDASTVAERITAADTAAGVDSVTVAETDYYTAADAGGGSDAASTADVPEETATVPDTASGSDAASVVDTELPISAPDTAAGTDTAAVVESVPSADTGTGTDTAQCSDRVPPVADTGTADDLFIFLDVPFTRVLAFRPGPTYEVVVVARIPQTSGLPTLIEVDPIEWSSLRYSNELSRPQTLEVTCLVDTVPETILQRLRKLHDLATELHLLRDGRRVFAGPLQGWRVGGETLSLSAHGLLAYLRLMVVNADLVYSQIDQFEIVTGLIDQWQNLDYGNYGIDTTMVGTSGQLRDATYLRDELHEVGQRVGELGGRRNGFDVEVDPVSRQLQLWSPAKGVDRSTGEDAVVFDARNITSSSVLCSVAPGSLASDAYGTGTSSGAGNLYSTQGNATLRSRYGRAAVTGTWSSVSEQPTLDAHVQGLLDARGEALLVPAPGLRVTPDADLTAYGVGDVVTFEVEQRLGVAGAFRVRKQDISVSSTGVEAVSVEFV